MEQGPEKSGCFCDLLRWSVGRHWLLRSRWTNSRQRARTRQSALTLIAFQARTIRCWFRFAWPVKQGHRSFGQHTNTAEIQVPLNHLQTKLSTIAKTTVLSAKSLKTLALKGQGRHRLTWRRLCLPCQANAIYEFDLSQLWESIPFPRRGI